MRKIILTAALTCATLCFGQKAETIETFAANSHETEWYKVQAQAWQEEVNEHPSDQWAWRNLFRATYYYDQFSEGFGEDQDVSRTADIIRKMQATLPDSYVLNLCTARFCLSSDSAALRGDNIYRAIELMPEDACAEDIDYLAARLWGIDPENPKIAELNKKTYQQSYYPERILRYNWNMLQSMEPDALYFANGDNLTKPMKTLQDALNERKDVKVIPLSFLWLDDFRDALCRQIGVKPIKIDEADYWKYGKDMTRHFYTDVIMYLLRESKRPAYFFSDILSLTNISKDNLYNEGLLLKYSDHPYDNFSVAMHNVKEVYHLEYLAEPNLMPSKWETSDRLDLNCVVLLSNLVSKLRAKGEESESQRLYTILEKCLERHPEGTIYREILEKEK